MFFFFMLFLFSLKYSTEACIQVCPMSHFNSYMSMIWIYVFTDNSIDDGDAAASVAAAAAADKDSDDQSY